MYSLLSVELYFGASAVAVTITFLVDSDIVSVPAALVLVLDIDFLFVESSIFPSSALGATLVLDFFLYLGGGSVLGSSVTPVRRREDTDRNGDAGVKVQFDRLGAP